MEHCFVQALSSSYKDRDEDKLIEWPAGELQVWLVSEHIVWFLTVPVPSELVMKWDGDKRIEWLAGELQVCGRWSIVLCKLTVASSNMAC